MLRVLHTSLMRVTERRGEMVCHFYVIRVVSVLNLATGNHFL
jgi:hypothetical protein